MAAVTLKVLALFCLLWCGEASEECTAENGANLVQAKQGVAKMKELKLSPGEKVASSAKLASFMQFMKEFGASNGDKTFKENVPEVQKVFDEMIALITDDIEPAIEDSFAAAQTSINTALSELDDATTLALDQKALAVTADSNYDTCRAQEKAALVDHETCTDEKDDLNAIKIAECQARDNAQVFTFEVTSNLKTQKECDFLADPNGCPDFSQLEQFVSNTESSITNARTVYMGKVQDCNDATTNFDNKVQECSDLSTDYNDKKTECNTKLGTAKVSICTFGARFQEKCKDLDDMNDLVQNVTDGSVTIQSESSRIAEWEAVQTVKCILESYVEGGTFNNATQTQCTNDIDYASDVGSMDYKSTEINDLTTTAKLSCTESDITFSDATWATGAQSSDYVQTTPYAVNVTLRPLGVKFASIC